jgi:hypothetical protein
MMLNPTSQNREWGFVFFGYISKEITNGMETDLKVIVGSHPFQGGLNRENISTYWNRICILGLGYCGNCTIRKNGK